MSLIEKRLRRVDRLAVRLQADDLRPQDEEALRDIIRNHPLERRRLVRHLVIEAGLREALDWASTGPQVVRSPKRGRSLRYFWLSLVMLALVLVALTDWQGGARGSEVVKKGAKVERAKGKTDAQGKVAPAGAERHEGFAVASASPGCLWKDAQGQVYGEDDRQVVLSGTALEVLEGVLRIEFYLGTSLLVTGPARLDELAAGGGRILSGQVVAKVPKAAEEFRLQGPDDSSVKGRGKFSVRSSVTRLEEVHNSWNSILLEEGEERLTLGPGEARRRNQNGEWQSVKVDPSLVRNHAAQRKTMRKQLQNWRKHRDRLAAREDTLVYYTFERDLAWVRSIKNRAHGADLATNGAVVGCESVPGRWPGKRAIRYQSSSNRVRLDLKKVLDALTLSLWVRVEEFERDRMALLNPDLRQNSYVHWSIVRMPQGGKKDAWNWVLDFAETSTGPKASIKERRNHYRCTIPIQGMLGGGKWAQVGLVYDSEAGEVRHYVNGRCLMAQTMKEKHPVSIGIVDLGNWPYREWASGTEFEVRNFNGRMGEFLISSHAYTDEEMAEMYRVGKP